MLYTGKFSLFSLVEGFTVACSRSLPFYNKWLGAALGSKVKSHYIIEHNVSIIATASSGSIIITFPGIAGIALQEALSIIRQGLVMGYYMGSTATLYRDSTGRDLCGMLCGVRQIAVGAYRKC